MATRSDRNIVITGFMGTGKTTIGQLVAERMGWPFVDTDDVIVDQAGKPIAQIFAEEGEAIFRHYERRVCRFYAGQCGYVLATGGGMLASSFVVCLQATKVAIQERLAEQSGRPLFSGDWEALYDQRQAAYAEIPNQIDTTNREPAEIVEEIIQLWRQLQ